MKKNLIIFVFIFLLAGCQPLHLSLPDNEPLMLISHLKEKKLSFIDLTTLDVVYSEAFPFEIHSLEMVAPNQVILAGKLEEELLLLDLRSGSIETLFEFGQGITSMNFDKREQHLILTDAKNNQLHVYHLKKKEKVTSIDVGKNPLQATLDDDGKYIYVISGGPSTVTVIDRTTFEVKLTFPVVEMPTDIHFDGQYIWIAGHGHFTKWSESIKAYDPLTGKKVKEIQVGLMPVYFYADSIGDEFYVLCHGSNELYVIDRNNYQVKQSVRVGDNPHYMSASERHLFVTSLDGNKLSVIDRDTYKVETEIELTAGPFGIAIGELENE
ncbi:YncE family protein [Alkalihalobacillus sp. BA299]|uniref:YncE family protein n=1 Tax=Alkalihalobacillus sp. BA299 TaxID=2815938 RepID=UPI001AD9E793|nr:YncE family protein [Alkalihalobacillus sp. BA299]